MSEYSKQEIIDKAVECLGEMLKEENRELRAELASAKQENERLRGQLESLVYSIAGTEGTKTNSELPEWYRARLREANEVLKGAKK